MTLGSDTVRFALRLLALLCGVAALVSFALHARWGSQAFGVLTWAVLWATLLGAIGYRGLSRGVASSSSSEMTRHVLGGLLLRLFLIVLAHAVAFRVLGAEWGRRALFSTVALYLVALACEVWSVHRQMRAAPRGRTESTAPGGGAGPGPV